MGLGLGGGSVLLDILMLLAACAAGYQMFSLVCAWLFRRWARRELARPLPADDALPGVTLLKPLRGVVAETYDNLANACRLDYPHLQIVFGVADPADPAVAVVERLRRDFPAVDIELVVSDRRIGSNGKVSNLDNMLARAKYDVLAMADADIRIAPEGLRRIVPYLERPEVGLVTCAYRAAEGGSLAHRIEALFVNTDFAPMVTVARQVERQSYAFGATICMRRHVLDEIGGFAAIADYLADDYQIGNRAAACGYVAVLAPVVVDTHLDLDGVGEVFAHQLRWARTNRVSRPASYFATVVTHTTLWATLCLLASGFSVGGWVAFAGAAGTRVLVGGLIADRVFGVREVWRRLWLIPFKDLFNSAIWAIAFLGSTVRWGDTTFTVGRDGRMTPVGGEDDTLPAGEAA